MGERTLEKTRPDEQQSVKGTAENGLISAAPRYLAGPIQLSQRWGYQTGDAKQGGSKMVCMVEPRLK